MSSLPLRIFSNVTFSLFLVLLAGCGASTTTGGTGSGTTTYAVTAPNAPTSYSLNGSANPNLTLQRNQTYTFNVSASGHPFYIMSVQGTNTGNAYNTGVTNNGSQSGTVTFVVPAGAPSTLYYNCSAHAGMTGTITVTN